MRNFITCASAAIAVLHRLSAAGQGKITSQTIIFNE
jgi:hypothetical protein